MNKTKIEWCDSTWNPIRGCSKISAGCANCYAERMAARFSGTGEPYEGLIRNNQWNGEVRLVDEHLHDPVKWRSPRKIFVNSMSDLFHDNLPKDGIDRIFSVMLNSPRHTFLILTKRQGRMREYVSNIKLPDNIWLGVSIENQRTADLRLPVLYDTPAPKKFVSIEPMIGSVNLSAYVRRLNWVIVGGESGPGRRPMDERWVISLAKQCARIPFFYKGRGDKSPALVNGRKIQQFPEGI